MREVNERRKLRGAETKFTLMNVKIGSHRTGDFKLISGSIKTFVVSGGKDSFYRNRTCTILKLEIW